MPLLPRLFFLLGALTSALPAANVERGDLTADEHKIVVAARQRIGNFPSDLEAVVRLSSPTESLAGVRAVARFFEAQLMAAGLPGKFLDLPPAVGRAGHLFAEHRGSGGRRVLLLGHLDTVLPGGNYSRQGERALGSGTNDIKGGDLVLTYALRALHDAGVLDRAQVIVLLTGDEEAVGQPQGVARAALLKAAHRSDVALSFEGAIGNTGTIARRGATTWEIEVQGATGHSSGIFSPAMGAGSVYEAARILDGFYRELRQFDGLTVNPALIVGGTEAELDRTHGRVEGKSNITAQRTLMRGDLRAMSGEQLAAVEGRMREIVGRHLPRTSATLTFSESYPPMPETPGNRALLALLDHASRDLGYAPITAYDPKARGAGDIAFVSPPLPGLDGLGLRGGGAHAPNEWADLASAPEMVERAALLIYRLTHQAN